MSDPLWRHGESRRAREERKATARRLRAKFVVEYDLAYEGGGGRWDGYYRTYFGARAAAFWNVHVSSYGGSAALYPYPKPLPPPTVGPRGKSASFFANTRRKKG